MIFFLGVEDINGSLQIDPQSCTRSESVGQANGRTGSHSGAVVCYVAQMLSRDTNLLGEPAHGDIARLKVMSYENSPGRGWSSSALGHGSFSASTCDAAE